MSGTHGSRPDDRVVLGAGISLVVVLSVLTVAAVSTGESLGLVIGAAEVAVAWGGPVPRSMRSLRWVLALFGVVTALLALASR